MTQHALGWTGSCYAKPSMWNGVLGRTLAGALIALCFPPGIGAAQPYAAGAGPAPIGPVPGTAQLAPAAAQLAPSPLTATPATSPTDASSAPLSLTAAVQTALRRHPALVQARAELALARGTLRAAQGPFDVALTTRLSHDHVAVRDLSGPARAINQGGLTIVQDTTNLRFGASTNLRWGTGLRASVGLARNGLRQQPGPDALDPIQTAITELAITQPFLRGAGSYGAASAVLAGEHGVRAAELRLAHAAQLQAYAVIAAYWDLVAAVQERALFEASHGRAARMLDETRELVEADRRPRGDLRALEAGLATRRRDLIDSERLRVRALHALRLAMGLDVGEARDWQPSDGFPSAGVPPLGPDELALRARQTRNDLRAAERDLAAARAIERGAERNVLPKLDLSLAVGYQGTVDRDGVGPFFDSLGRNVAGLNASGAVELEVPIDNDAAQGERARAAAQRMLAETARADLARTLQHHVRAAYDELRAEVEALDAARAAEAGYGQALEDERAKLRAGLSTVLDTIVLEDLATQATRARLGTELALALALARLRLELGSLPSSEVGAAQALTGVLDAGVLDGH